MPQFKYRASGTYVIASQGTGTGEVGYQVTVTPRESWSGSLVFKQNTAPPGSVPVYTSVAYQNANTGEEVAAGTAITDTAAIIISPTVGDLVVVVTMTAGEIIINVNPATAGVTNRELMNAFLAAGYDTAGQDTTEAMLSVAVADMLGTTLNVKAFGAVGDGVTDDTAAIQAAIDAAATRGFGTVFFPSGRYIVTDTLTVPAGILLQGTGSPGSSSGSSQVFAEIFHEFDGDLLDFTGSLAVGAGFGGGVDRLSLVQNFGSSGGATVGKAINVTIASEDARPIWFRMTNSNIENFSYSAPWSYGLYIDGSAIDDLSRDHWVSNSRVTVQTGGTAAIYVASCANAFFLGVECNAAGGKVIVTGTAGRRSSNIHFVGCSVAAAFEMDYADSVLVSGGNYTSWTNTANTGTGTPCVILPSYSAARLTNNAGSGTIFAVYSSAFGYRFNQSLTEDNGVYLRSVTNDGLSTKRLIGLSNTDVVNIDLDGAGARFGGSTTFVGSLSPATTLTPSIGSNSFRFLNTFTGGLFQGIRTETSTYAATNGDYTILCDATGGAFSVNLPAASTAGRTLCIKKIDSSGNAVTIDPNGGELIDGAATYPLAAQWDAATIQSNGTAWYVLSIGP